MGAAHCTVRVCGILQPEAYCLIYSSQRLEAVKNSIHYLKTCFLGCSIIKLPLKKQLYNQQTGAVYSLLSIIVIVVKAHHLCTD